MGDDGSLDAISLTPGETVRWRRRDGGHWQDGVVIRREADGSVAVRDGDGAWRSIRVERLEARAEGRRGALHWEPVQDRASRPTQLRLWDGRER